MIALSVVEEAPLEVEKRCGALGDEWADGGVGRNIGTCVVI